MSFLSLPLPRPIQGSQCFLGRLRTILKITETPFQAYRSLLPNHEGLLNILAQIFSRTFCSVLELEN